MLRHVLRRLRSPHHRYIPLLLQPVLQPSDGILRPLQPRLGEVRRVPDAPSVGVGSFQRLARELALLHSPRSFLHRARLRALGFLRHLLDASADASDHAVAFDEPRLCLHGCFVDLTLQRPFRGFQVRAQVLGPSHLVARLERVELRAHGLDLPLDHTDLVHHDVAQGTERLAHSPELRPQFVVLRPGFLPFPSHRRDLSLELGELPELHQGLLGPREHRGRHGVRHHPPMTAANEVSEAFSIMLTTSSFRSDR